jgi:hypothetical protein
MGRLEYYVDMLLLGHKVWSLVYSWIFQSCFLLKVSDKCINKLTIQESHSR